MNINQMLKGLEGHLGCRHKFIGVFLSDNLEHIKREKLPVVFIVNTLTRNDPISIMGHYIVMYYDSIHKYLYFIDSYKFDVEFYNKGIKDFCQGLKIIYLPFRLQHYTSIVCGLYAIFFTLIITNNGVDSVNTSVKMYFKRGKPSFNDVIVTKYCYKRLKNNLPPYNNV